MKSTLSRVDGPALALGAVRPATFLDYVELTKPRIIVLLLISTISAMVMAAKGIPPLALTFWTLVGGALAAASAGAFNCVYDGDIDARMKRTLGRPIPRGVIPVERALAYAMALGAASFLLLYYAANPLAAWLSLGGNAFYVFIYTMWLKRSTSQNIVIGGAAGSIPPLVGWAAVTGSLGPPAIALFALIFLWTPPHFWALALMTDIDYEKAGIPMLPNVAGVAHTKRAILAYTIAMVGMCVLFVVLGIMGPLFLAVSLALGARFLFDAVKLQSDPTKRYARTMFKFSLLYLAVMCAAMPLDRILFR